MGTITLIRSEQQGVHVIESEFIAEILDPLTDEPVKEGEVGELILTNLRRWGYPVIRYRTGDLVRHGGYGCACGRSFLLLPGGVLGRADDMLIMRGVNVYPSALANILHLFPEVIEYRVIVTKNGALDEIVLQVECPAELVPVLQDIPPGPAFTHSYRSCGSRNAPPVRVEGQTDR